METSVGMIQLRRGKTLLEKPVIKKKTKISKGGPSTPGQPAETLNSTPETPQAGVAPTPPPTTSRTPLAPVQSLEPASEPSPSTVALTLEKFHDLIKEGYKTDTQFSKALTDGVSSGVYMERDGLLYTGAKKDQLCIPNIKVRGGRDGAEKSLREMLIAHAHETLGHMGTYRMSARLHCEFYWKSMTSDVDKYVRSCHYCQVKKAFPSKQYGKHHALPVPTGPW